MMPAVQPQAGISLHALLDGILDASALAACPPVVVAGIAQDSREVGENYLFAAVPGTATHGLQFAVNAVESGASVVLWDRADAAEQRVLDSLADRVLCIRIEGLQSRIGEIASRFYGQPSRALNLIGVTGTDGKTSVSHYIAQCLNSEASPCGVLGTLGNGLIHDLKPTGLTTASAVRVQRSLAGLVADGAVAAVMEVSSHGLDQGRVNGVEFDTAVFTNLSQDHLDYHGNMDAYFGAKSKLFEMIGLKSAVVNLDDAFGREIARAYCKQLTMYGYTASPDGEKLASNIDHLIYAQSIKSTRHGFQMQLVTPAGDAEFELGLLGEFNVSNALAVLATLLANDLSLAESLERLRSIRPVAGRMELIERDNHPTVIVDYAHTPQGLAAACKAARQHFDGQLWCVFGCGGDRDREKRPLMARAAEPFADHVVVTSDNPRNEDPQLIIRQIVDGFDQPQHIESYLDRREAMRHAITRAAANDVVLVAGKGHESFQIIGDQCIDFDDRAVARDLLADLDAGVGE